jgi:sporulation protein YlmC with PRC-barrel domain
MNSSDLQGKRVRTEAGQGLGRVVEIHAEAGEVTALTCGRGGVLQRFTSSRRGHRVKWSQVRRITDREVVIADP